MKIELYLLYFIFTGMQGKEVQHMMSRTLYFTWYINTTIIIVITELTIFTESFMNICLTYVSTNYVMWETLFSDESKKE